MSILAAEGKTKKIILIPKKPGMCIVVSKDDVTAGDGKRHDVIPGKGRLSNLTTCHVFELLGKNTDVPLAYSKRSSQCAFEAHYCTAIQLEVVVRFKSRGSYGKRNPDCLEGTELPSVVVEFFYKTSGRLIGKIGIACDDPLLIFENGTARLYHPSKPGEIILDDLTKAVDPLLVAFLQKVMPELVKLAEEVGSELRWAWQKMNGDIDDFKIEFGIDQNGKIRLIDVIDIDSIRAWYLGQEVSKEPYRNDCSVQDFFEVLVVGEAVTRRFVHLPNEV
ncbi:MAG: hypothetical protein RLZZ76_56 [Candidatus Parcubacteria bacterium]|jgi:phosphoribosylaminoimidazole-succinocarboxamide synthase